MAQIIVRKINDEAMERLRMLASERNMSLEAFARRALEQEAEQSSQAELQQAWEKLEKMRAAVPKGVPDSTQILRALRDGDELYG